MHSRDITYFYINLDVTSVVGYDNKSLEHKWFKNISTGSCREYFKKQ